MQTHFNNQHEQSQFLERLRERADAAERAKASTITVDGEPLAEWKHGGVSVRHLPDDEQGILRISVGGGNTPVPLNYCVIRGDLGQCIELLEKAVVALRAAP